MEPQADFAFQDWTLSRVAWFRRPVDEFGGFSNMSRAFPLTIFGMRIRSSEHLYQAMRFPHEPAIQRAVLEAATPMFSKRVSREWDPFTRTDWMKIRVDVMRWVLRVKLSQHADTFGNLLLSTGTRPILEWSRHDSFWGASPVTTETVHGQNVLGRLLSELRENDVEDRPAARTVPPPAFPEPRLLGIEIGALSNGDALPLLTADDLRAAGLPPGPAFGPVLKACLQKQWNGEFTDRATGLQIAQRIWADHTRDGGYAVLPGTDQSRL